MTKRDGATNRVGRRSTVGLVVLVALLSSVVTAASAAADPGIPNPVPPADGSAGLPALPGPPALPGVTGPRLPANDFEALLALPPVQMADMEPARTIRGPELMPVPRAECDADSRPLAGVQGRVPANAINSPAARRGWQCNVTQVSHHLTPGGYRVWRYTDRDGRSCAYYDTSFAAPANAVRLFGGPSLGVAVLDMTDSAHPVLFPGERADELPKLTYMRAWRSARKIAFTEEVARSPLAATPYDLRHACVSTWLNGGVLPADVAEWAGHSVEVLLKVYAKTIDKQDEQARRRVMEALGYR